MLLSWLRSYALIQRFRCRASFRHLQKRMINIFSSMFAVPYIYHVAFGCCLNGFVSFEFRTDFASASLAFFAAPQLDKNVYTAAVKVSPRFAAPLMFSFLLFCCVCFCLFFKRDSTQRSTAVALETPLQAMVHMRFLNIAPHILSCVSFSPTSKSNPIFI
jgi:hypothetical protein